MEIQTILTSAVGALSATIVVLWRHQVHQDRLERDTLRKQLTEANEQIRTLTHQWTEEVKQRSHDAALYLTALERRRNASLPPSPRPPTLLRPKR